jgi:hypothetical protein
VKFIALPPGGWSRLESRSTTVTVPLEETEDDPLVVEVGGGLLVNHTLRLEP